MTEHEPDVADSTGDDLADRLRAGLDALADEVGDPPPFPETGRPARPAPSRAYALSAAALVLVALAVGTFAWTQRDGDQQVATVSTTQPAPDRPLVGTRWWLDAVADHGRPVDLPDQALGLQIRKQATCEGYVGGTCETGQLVLWAADRCNGVQRIVVAGRATLELGDAGGPTTLMACTDPFTDLVKAVFRPGPASYRIDGEELTVTRDGTRLTYRASDSPFGPTNGTIIDEGEIGPASYRVVYADGGLGFAKGDTKQDIVEGGSGLGDDPGRTNMTRESVQGRPYVLAIVPKAAVRVVYEAPGEEPMEMEVHQVDSKVSSVVAGFVPTAAETWQLTAYDAHGQELHRYAIWPRKDMGAGRSIEEVVSAAGFDDCCTDSGARTAFTAEGVPMTFGSAPLPPTMPRDPAEGLEGAGRVTVAADGQAAGTVVVGAIGDDAAVRFDCAETRYEVRGPAAEAGLVQDAAVRLSAAAGCPEVHIAEAG